MKPGNDDKWVEILLRGGPEEALGPRWAQSGKKVQKRGDRLEKLPPLLGVFSRKIVIGTTFVLGVL